jgi:hypothetical protein
MSFLTRHQLKLIPVKHHPCVTLDQTALQFFPR